MPLLMSPVSGEPMKQVIRNGIEIDVCPTSGGVWLDKGELEKLIALMSAANEQPPPRRADYRDRERYDRDDDDDDRIFSGGRGGGRRERREGPLANIMEMFEF